MINIVFYLFPNFNFSLFHFFTFSLFHFYHFFIRISENIAKVYI